MIERERASEGERERREEERKRERERERKWEHDMMISFMLLCVSSTIDKRLNGLGSRRCDMACDMVCDMCACLYARPADKIKNKTKQNKKGQTC